MEEIDLYFKKLDAAIEAGERRQIRSALNVIMQDRSRIYAACNSAEKYDRLSKALLHALILELDEEEEDSLEAAEMCYAALGRIIKISDISMLDPEIIKRRLLLLHYFSDYLTDSVAELFMSETRKKHLLDARNLAIDCLDRMQLLDLCWLGENYPEWVEEDDQIKGCDASLTRNIKHDEIETALKNAEIMHKALTAYLIVKYKRLK